MSTATLFDVEKVLQKKSWWAIIFILPLARRLSLFFINRTNITPNAITLFAFLFVPIAAFFYLTGTYAGLVLGALFFEINYLFDCMDGTVARVKGMSSPVGGYLDAMLDRVRILLLCLALGYGQWRSGGSVVLLFWLMFYLGVNNLIIITRGYQERALAKAGFASRLGVDLVGGDNSSILGRWVSFTGRRNLMPYYHDVELDALVFLVGPLMGQTLVAVQVAVVAGLALVLALNIIFLRSLAAKQKSSGG
ncbi:MAG: CDP-alcohol phosphatidyltransferase family protein [Deltaproteobacteria bacterium]|nr:CDP-alcohol phosphatidyltransferase family protein [Deltaproteobacteria bacterium]